MIVVITTRSSCWPRSDDEAKEAAIALNKTNFDCVGNANMSGVPLPAQEPET
jgi:hypothetical protein